MKHASGRSRSLSLLPGKAVMADLSGPFVGNTVRHGFGRGNQNPSSDLGGGP